MILNLNILGGISMPRLFRIKLKYFYLFIFCLFYSGIFSQENYFKNIQITPSICTGEDGMISLDPPPHYIDFIWDDGSTELNRESLNAGIYTLYGEDEEGCIETLVLEVPDISKCDLELSTWFIPTPINPIPSDPAPKDDRPLKPCVIFGVNFTLNGQIVPNEHLDIVWTVTIPIPFPPYSTTYTTNQPTVAVYNGTTVNVEVSLIVDGQKVPCCILTDKFFVGDYCRQLLPPKVFTYRSTFRDPANINNIPGLVELLVYGDGSCGGTTDLRGFILDDNNGELIPPQDSNLIIGSTLNIDPGYIRFSNHQNWASIPNGSIITIYESRHALNNSVTSLDDPTDINGDFHYVLGLENSVYFNGYTTTWDFTKQTTPYVEHPTTLGWNLIEANGRADAMQVRYPDGTYCHGFSYGKTNTSTEENLFALYLTDTDHPYCQIRMEELSYTNKSLFSLEPITGGFTPGQLGDGYLDLIMTHLRDCNIVLPTNETENGDAVQSRLSPSNNIQQNDLNNKAIASLDVYPNPFKQFLQIDFQSNITGVGSIWIYDSQGRKIEQIQVDCNTDKQTITTDFGSKSRGGLYLIQFRSPDNHFISKKAILIDLD